MRRLFKPRLGAQSVASVVFSNALADDAMERMPVRNHVLPKPNGGANVWCLTCLTRLGSHFAFHLGPTHGNPELQETYYCNCPL